MEVTDVELACGFCLSSTALKSGVVIPESAIAL